MLISEKEKIIINTLLKSDKALSIKDLSKATRIKERTLYREIKNVEYFLKSYSIELIKDKSKYLISGDTSLLDPELLDTSIELGYSPDTKINLILSNLLILKETSIKDLSEKLLISYNTVASTMPNIENILADYKISIFKKKGQGIYLEGDSDDKRILFLALLWNEIKDDEFYYLLNSDNDFSPNPFFKFLDIEMLRSIFFNNRDLEVFRIYTDSSIKKILIAINIFLHIQESSQKPLERVLDADQNNISILTERLVSYNNIYRSEIFKNFIAKILKTCKLIDQVTYVNDKYSYTLIFKVHTLIRNVSKKSNIDFSQDINLASGLITHIESAIKRYQLKLIEENNDLKEFVQTNYNELYLLVKSELLNVFDEINFNSTELSYIVIHFASSYEQIYRENFVRALVVCSSGIGSSKILGSLIRKNIPEIKNIEYSTPVKLEEDLKNNYDIIISTLKLEEDLDYVLIPTILQSEDIKKIKEKLLSVRSFKKVSYNKTQDKVDTTTIEKILANTSLKIQSVISNDVEVLLREAVEDFSATNSLIKHLIARHEKSSIVIPNTNIALFHTLEDNLKDPKIVVYSLSECLPMVNALGHLEDVTTFFVMVSPNKLAYTEFLGQISIAILEDKSLKDALSTKNINYIKATLELIMTKYLLNKNI